MTTKTGPHPGTIAAWFVTYITWRVLPVPDAALGAALLTWTALSVYVWVCYIIPEAIGASRRFVHWYGWRRSIILLAIPAAAAGAIVYLTGMVPASLVFAVGVFCLLRAYWPGIPQIDQ